MPFVLMSSWERLVDKGSMQSKLLLVYLHALTSACLPDRLTKNTGTEQSLDILHSAGLRSFETLTEEYVGTFLRIAALAPRRAFYPAQERVMQTVQWSTTLAPTSQHPRFHTRVETIVNQARAFNRLFHGSDRVIPSIPDVDGYLLERDQIRVSLVRVGEYGGEDHTSQHDTQYVSRDRDTHSTRYLSAYRFSSQIYHLRRSRCYSSL